MIDCRAVAAGFLAVASSAPSKTGAARALDPLVAALRAELLAPVSNTDPVPRMRTDTLPAVAGTEGGDALACRLRVRLDELALAKRFGNATDVQWLADIVIGELRHAALARVP